MLPSAQKAEVQRIPAFAGLTEFCNTSADLPLVITANCWKQAGRSLCSSFLELRPSGSEPAFCKDFLSSAKMFCPNHPGEITYPPLGMLACSYKAIYDPKTFSFDITGTMENTEKNARVMCSPAGHYCHYYIVLSQPLQLLLPLTFLPQ